jgi:hypothetical protein
MVRMAWKLRREGGGAKDEKGGGIIILSFSSCQSATKITAAINCTTAGTRGSEKHGHSVGVRSFFLYLPEMPTTAGNYELERKRV